MQINEWPNTCGWLGFCTNKGYFVTAEILTTECKPIINLTFTGEARITMPCQQWKRLVKNPNKCKTVSSHTIKQWLHVLFYTVPFAWLVLLQLSAMLFHRYNTFITPEYYGSRELRKLIMTLLTIILSMSFSHDNEKITAFSRDNKACFLMTPVNVSCFLMMS